MSALEAVGASVQRLNAGGVPDLIVGWRGRMWLIEVKLPLTARGAVQPGRHLASKGGSGDMTADQVAWWEWWRGPDPIVVRTPQEALSAIGASTDPPAELVPDAIAVAAQRRPRIR